MADYYPLIARAVTGLDKNTGEARRALYERARTALVTQLRGVEPALGEGNITRERLALEEAIRKVEAEAARRPRQEAPESPRAPAVAPLPHFERPAAAYVPSPPPPPPPPPPPELRFAQTPPPPEWRDLQRELDGLAPPSRPDAHAYEDDRVALEPGADEPPLPLGEESHPEPAAEAWEPPAPVRRFERKVPGESPSLVDEGLKGFRDVIAESGDLGGAAASAAKSARETREAFSALPHAGEIERIEPAMLEPSFGPEDLMPSEPSFSSPRPEPRAARGRAAPMRPSPTEFGELEEQHFRQGRGSLLGKILVVAALLALVGAGVFAYREWGGGIAGMLQSAREPATQTKEAPAARPKIADRIGGAQQDSPPAGNAAAVAQRAILFELGASAQDRKQYVGSVIWRTESTSPGPGKKPDTAVKAEVEIPERHMRVGLSLQRNLDQSLPATHTIEILFSTPADFAPGGVANVAAVLMENTERGGASQLAGLGVKVTNGFFLVGLSTEETFAQRNLQLLKERPLMQIRMVYNNGQNAMLVLEKGVPGDRAFEEALNAWGQNQQR